MKELQLREKVEAVLDELRKQIVVLAESERTEDANFFLEQYIKLAPEAVERYSLEAMIRASEKNWQGAAEILQEGLRRHPLSFDLIYNLGYLFEEQQDILEAYHLYMKARYVAETTGEKKDIAAALKRLVKDIRGSVKTQEGKTSTIVKAGNITMTVTSRTAELLRRKEVLGLIENNIDKNLTAVLEIGFIDGIISKNLNYFGYDVTAVDRRKENILNVIAAEWHDNILHPEQKVAKFYQEPVSLEWLRRIPEFEAIIAVAGGTMGAFDAGAGDTGEILATLISKAQKQLFLGVPAGSSSSGFTLDELEKVAAAHALKVKALAVPGNGGSEDLKICLINKFSKPEVFRVPKAGEVRDSRSTIFEVELAKCVDLYGAGYTGDWHPFVETLKQYQQNPGLHYENSVLKEYYERFQPANLEEALFVRRGRASRLNMGWIGFPWFWDKSREVIFEKSPGETRPGGNHHFGPNSMKFASAEFDRLLPLYRMIKKEGYHPELFFDGYISGYLMIRGEDYRFVVTEGQHRMACLAALGYEKIRCRFSLQPQYPRVVAWEEVNKWSQVANKTYGRGLAIKIFDRYFAGNVGLERMGLN